MEKFGSGINIPDPQHWYLEKGTNICKWAILKRSGQNIVARPNIKTNVVDVKKKQAQTLSTES
jgi:hypothetical protein